MIKINKKLLIYFLAIIAINFFFIEIAKSEYDNWTRSGGSNYSLKFSSASQITRINIGDLTKAWTFHIGNDGLVQVNPIYANNAIFTTSRDGSVISLNPKSGIQNWRHKIGAEVGRRGITFYKNNIYVPSSSGVFVLNALDGQLNTNYGNRGKFGDGSSSLPPVVTEDTLITANVTSVESYEFKTGKLKWSTNLEKEGVIPRIWSGLSYDEKNKIIFVVTSNAAWFLDMDVGDAGHCNSLVAIDALSGKVLWTIKETKHDIWDLDVVGPPIIADLKLNNKLTQVVIAVTKSGNTLFANRLTGKLIYDAKYKTLTDRNDFPPVTQLDIVKPEPFARNYFNPSVDVTTLSAEKQISVRHKIKNIKDGNLVPVSTDYDVVMYGLHGGAQWPGASLDPYSNTLVVPSNRYPWILRVRYFDTNEAKTIELSNKNNLYKNKCASCHGANLRGWYQNEFLGDIHVPSLINMTHKMDVDTFTHVEKFKSMHNFSAYMAGGFVSPQYIEDQKKKRVEINDRLVRNLRIIGLTEKRSNIISNSIMGLFSTEINIDKFKIDSEDSIKKISSADLAKIYSFIQSNDVRINKEKTLGREPVLQMLLDKDGLPGSNPPWGEMTAIDLNSGHIKWKIPFGEVKDPSSKNIIFGDVNFGGAIITKPGLIFANGTRDGYARAFNIQNGEELWKASLPAPGSAPPMTYNFEGCQYVVFTATGGQFYGYRRSDAIVAYKLKNCSPK